MADNSRILIDIISRVQDNKIQFAKEALSDIYAVTGDGYNARYLSYTLRTSSQKDAGNAWFVMSNFNASVGATVQFQTNNDDHEWPQMTNRLFVVVDQSTKWTNYQLFTMTGGLTEIKQDVSDGPDFRYYQFNGRLEAKLGTLASGQAVYVKVPDFDGRYSVAAYTMTTPTTFAATARVDGHLLSIAADDPSIRTGFYYWQVEQADDTAGTGSVVNIYSQANMPALVDVDPGTLKYYRIKSVSVLGDESAWSGWISANYNVVPAQAVWKSHVYAIDGHIMNWSHANPASVNYFHIYRNTSASDSGATFVGTYARDETSALIPYAATGSYFGIRAVGYAGTYAATVWSTGYDGSVQPVINLYDIPGYAVIAFDPTDTSHTLGSVAGYKVEQAADSSGTGATTLDSLRPYSGFPYQVAQAPLSTKCYRLTPVSVSGTAGTPTAWTCLTVTAGEGGFKDYFDGYGGYDFKDIESLQWGTIWDLRTSEWSVPSEVSDSTDYTVDGDVSLKFTPTTAVVGVSKYHNPPIDLDVNSRFSSDDYLLLSAYVSRLGLNSGKASIQIKFMSGSSGSGSASHQWDLTSTGWHFLKVKKGDFVLSSSPANDWSIIYYTQLYVYSDFPDSATDPIVYIADLRIVKADPDDATTYNDTGKVWNFIDRTTGGGAGQWHIYEGNRAGEPSKPFSMGQIVESTDWRFACVNGLDVEAGTVQVGYYKKTSGRVGLIFYCTDMETTSRDFYSVLSYGTIIYLYRWINNGTVLLASVPYVDTLNAITWLGVDLREFESDPGRIKVYASNTEGNLIQAKNLIISHKDTSPLPSGGSAGVVTYSTNARFVNFSAGSPAHADLADVARSLDGPIISGMSDRLWLRDNAGALEKSTDGESFSAVVTTAGYTLVDYSVATLGSDFSTTSTSFVDVLSLTSPVLVSGDVLEVEASANFYISRATSSSYAYYQMLINGVAYPMQIQYLSIAGATSVAFTPFPGKTKMVTGLSGAITIKLQGRTGNSETMTCNASSEPGSYQAGLIAKVWRPV